LVRVEVVKAEGGLKCTSCGAARPELANFTGSEAVSDLIAVDLGEERSLTRVRLCGSCAGEMVGKLFKAVHGKERS
jgi:hypothetical protein